MANKTPRDMLLSSDRTLKIKKKIMRTHKCGQNTFL